MSALESNRVYVQEALGTVGICDFTFVGLMRGLTHTVRASAKAVVWKVTMFYLKVIQLLILKHLPEEQGLEALESTIFCTLILLS